MPNVTTSQIIVNGDRNAVVRLTCFSDGTNETNVLKVDATKTGPLGTFAKGQWFYPGTNLVVKRVDYDVNGMTLRIQWDGAPNTDMLVLGGFGTRDFTRFAGLTVPAGMPGATGSIDFATAGAAAGSNYSVVLHLTKYTQE